MATTKLTSITLKAFRSFANEATIKLPDHGLVLIKGKNVDTPGVSSGSGKSSLLLALAYGLGYCPFPATELQSWLTKDSMEVSLNLISKEGRHTIKRGSKTLLTGDKYGVSGANATNETLQKLVGLDPELLAALTYRPQQTRGLFLSKTNSEMQDFLSILLGMDKFEYAISQAQDNIRNLTAKLELAKSKRDSAIQAHTDAQNVPLMGQLEIPTYLIAEAANGVQSAAENARTAARKLRVAKENLEAEENKIREQMKGEFDACDTPFVADRSQQEYWQRLLDHCLARRTKLQEEWDETVSLLEGEKTKCERQIWEANKKLEKIPAIHQEIKSLREKKCPRCHQSWHDTVGEIQALENELNKMIELENDVIHWKRNVADANASIAAGYPLLTEMIEAYQHAQLELAKASTEIANQQKLWKAEVARKQAEVAARVHTLIEAKRKMMVPEIEALDRVLRQADMELTNAKNNLANIKDKNEQLAQRNFEAAKRDATVLAALDKAREQMDQAVANVDVLSKDLAQEQDLLLLLKDFMGKIFDEVLAEIAWNTNLMLSKVPNVAHVTLGFRSEVVTLKGNTKKSIVPTLMIDGSERPLRSALSGGMLAAVELAVDLAVRTVISARSGNTPGWLVLDECFEGLGVVEKEACMGLLQQAAQDTLILIVDHSSEFKELFTQIIEIENKNGRSTLKE